MSEYKGAFAIVPETIFHLDITPNEMRVLIGLLSFRNKNTGLCNPGLDTLAERICLDRWATSRASSSLAKKGYVKKKRKGFSGRQGYKLNLPDDSLLTEKRNNADQTIAENNQPVLSETVKNSVAENSQEQITDNITNNKHTNGEFLAFWTQYPKKKSKGAAEKAFKKLTEHDFSAVFAGLDRACKHWKDTDPKYIPHPATWLNAEGWLDEYDIKMQQSAIQDNQSTTYQRDDTPKAANGSEMVKQLRQRVAK